MIVNDVILYMISQTVKCLYVRPSCSSPLPTTVHGGTILCVCFTFGRILDLARKTAILFCQYFFFFLCFLIRQQVKAARNDGRPATAFLRNTLQTNRKKIYKLNEKIPSRRMKRFDPGRGSIIFPGEVYNLYTYFFF